MSFAENLLYLRKKEDITQEQFAERLEVSRQSGAKWKSGASYPEMDKLLQIYSLFHCSLDVLMQGNAEQTYAAANTGYENQMNRHSRLCIAEMGIILFGFSVMLFLTGAGMQDAFHRKYIVLAAAGIGSILIGLIWLTGIEAFPLPKDYSEELFYGVFVLLVSIGSMLPVYGNTQKSKFNIDKYNAKADPDSLSPEKSSLASFTAALCCWPPLFSYAPASSLIYSTFRGLSFCNKPSVGRRNVYFIFFFSGNRQA